MESQNTTSASQPMGESTKQFIQPKMWKDLLVEEKLERVREQIKNLQDQFSFAKNQTQQLENDLKNHEHLNGKVVKDIKTINNFNSIGGLRALHNPKAEAEGNVYF